MLTLNIIPQTSKKNIKYQIIYKSLKNIFSILVIMLIFYAIILLVAKLILQLQFIKTVEDTTLVTKSTELYNRNLRDLNNQMSSITKIQDDWVIWSKLYRYIDNNIPNGIKLSQLNVDKTVNKIFLRGNASTRDELLELKTILEKSNFFEQIDFPIKNLLEKTNINFDISAKIKSYEF